MDDTSNGALPRTPDIEDLISLCKSLNEQGARYALIGGFAVIMHGFVRGTKDIDLLVDSSVENVRKIKKALSILPDNAIAQMEDDEVQKYTVVRIGDEIVVDLMEKACQIDYETAKDMIEFREIEGVRIPLAKKELLIRLKDTIRPSDKMDVEFLKWRIEEEKKK